MRTLTPRLSTCAAFFVVSALLVAGCDPEVASGEDAGVPQVDAAADAGADTSVAPDVGTPIDAAEDASPACDPCDYVPETSYDSTRALMDLTVTSAAGGRELPVLLRLPEGASGPLPVVIWAHGGSWGATKHTSHVAWSESFARAGYAVVHFSMVRPTPEQLRQICMYVGVEEASSCEDLSVLGGISEDDESGDNPFQSITIARAEDPRAIIEALPRVAERAARGDVELDVSSVAVAGWSGGSQSVLQLAGAVRLYADDLPPYASESAAPSSFVALSPQGPGFSKFFEGADGSSWDGVRGPTLVLTGAGDVKDANTLTGPIRRRAFELMPEGGKRLFYSTDEGDGIKHGSFNLEGLGDDDPRIDGLARALQSSAIAFVDCHTRGRAQACAWLESDAAARMVGGLVERETK